MGKPVTTSFRSLDEDAAVGTFSSGHGRGRRLPPSLDVVKENLAV